MRPKIGNGYLLLLNRPGLIPWGTGGRASHALMSVWHATKFGRALLVVEAREGKGIRAVTLSSQVRRFPGLIDLYEPVGCPREVREYAAWIAMLQTGKGYDYAGLFRVAFERLKILSGAAYLLGLTLREAPTGWDDDKFCSEGFHWFYLRAIDELESRTKWRPIYNIAPRRVVPVDLERTGSFRCVARGLTHGKVAA